MGLYQACKPIVVFSKKESKWGDAVLNGARILDINMLFLVLEQSSYQTKILTQEGIVGWIQANLGCTHAMD